MGPGAPLVDPFLTAQASLKHRLKTAKFDELLRDDALALQAMIEQRQGKAWIPDRLDLLKASCLVSETLDYFGDLAGSQHAVRDGQAVLVRLFGDPVPMDLFSRKLALERVRSCLDFAHTHLYRLHKLSDALDTIERCERFVQAHLVDRDMKCHGTLSQIYYYKGRVCRQLFADERAEACFTAAMENTYLRAKAKDTPDEVAFARHRAAVCLGLGMGLLNAARGRLRFAMRCMIRPAQVLMLEAGGGRAR